MNDVEFRPFKSLKLKHSRGDQIIKSFYGIGSPKETRSPLFKLKNFWEVEKKNQLEYIEI